jgi:hypothetical protein
VRAARPRTAANAPFQSSTLRLGIPAFCRESEGQGNGGQRQRYVNEKNGAPGHGIDQPTSQDRADCEGQGAEPGPRADRLATFMLVERRAEERKACRGQQGRPDSLQGARNDQGSDPRDEPAAHRGHGENAHARQERNPATVAIGHCPADQHQRAEHQKVCVHNPLGRGGIRAQALLDGGQGDVDNRAVDKGHARPEDGCGQRHPLAER